MKHITGEWENTQQRSFTKWMNSHLKKRNLQLIENPIEELYTGVHLINLYEIISNESLGKYYKDPQSKFHQIANLNLVIDRINQVVGSLGIKLQFSAEQIFNKEKRQILGLIWTLILRFQITKVTLEKSPLIPEAKQQQGTSLDTTNTATNTTTINTNQNDLTISKPTFDLNKQQKPSTTKASSSNSGDSAKMELLKWVQSKTKDIEPLCNIKDFTKSWQDGKALHHLIKALKPKALKKLTVPLNESIVGEDDDSEKAIELVKDLIRIAEEEMDIPEIIDPEDLVTAPEELSIMTYISYFRDYELNYPLEQDEEEEQVATTIEVPPTTTTPIIEQQQPIITEEEENDDDLNDLLKPEVDPTQCIVSGDAFNTEQPPKPNELTNFNIELFDSVLDKYIPSNNNEELQILINLFSNNDLNDELSKIPIHIKYLEENKYNVSFILPIGIKDIKIIIIINGESIRDEPFEIPNYILNIDYNNTIIEGKGIEPFNLYIYEDTNFKIITKDSNNNLLNVGGQEFDIKIINLNTNMEDIIDFNIEDNNDGTYLVNYTPLCDPGNYQLNIFTKNNLEEEILIHKEPFDVIFYQRISLQNSKITNYSNNRLILELKDENNQLINYLNPNEEIEIKNQNFENLKFKNNFDGTIDILDLNENDLQINVTINGIPIENNPYLVQNSLKVKLNNNKLYSTPFTKLKDLLKDKQFTYLEPIYLENLNISKFKSIVIDLNNNTINSQIINLGNDKYQIYFKPNKNSNNYKSKLFYENELLNESIIEILPEMFNIPYKCIVKNLKGSDLESNENIPANFTINTIYSNNKNMIPFIDFNNLNPIKYKNKKQLNNLIKKLLNDHDFINNLLNLPNLENNNITTIDHLNLENIDYNITDELKNQILNHIKNIPIKVNINLLKNQLPIIVLYTNPGEFEVFYEPKEIGTLEIQLFNNKNKLGNSYFTNITRGYDPNNCKVYGPGLNKCYKSKPTFIQLQTNMSPINFDKNKTLQCKVGGQDFLMKITDYCNNENINLPIEMIDNNNGKYDIKFIAPNNRGQYLLFIKDKFGNDINNSPFKLNVRDDSCVPDVNQCEIIGLKPNMKSNDCQSIFIQMKDKFGNPMKLGNDPLKIKLVNTSNPLMKPIIIQNNIDYNNDDYNDELKLYDANTGKYKLNIKPKECGKYKLYISLLDNNNDDSILGEELLFKDCPLDLNVHSNISPIYTKLDNWNFNVLLSNNQELLNDSDLNIKLINENIIYPNIEKVDGKVYNVSYIPTPNMECIIYGNVCGYKIQGIPFKQIHQLNL